jgi:CheY-specific phosphatase CheX
MCAASVADNAFGLMEDSLVKSTVELFGGYNLAVEPRPSAGEIADAEGKFVVSVIGFAGDGLRGALVLVATPSTVMEWLRAIDGGEASGDLCDTIGEFSNMLLGRLKGKLLREGLPILLSTPTTAIGLNLGLAASGATSKWFEFASADWRAAVRLHATFDENFSLRGAISEEQPAEAGDMMMF